MGKKQPIELFMPPNMLKAKVGGGLGGVDLAAMQRAQLAIEVLKSEFPQWIATDVKKLMDARTRYYQTPDTAAREALWRSAHDIKGHAPSFSYPLIAHVAESLSRLIAELPAEAAIPMTLV